MPQSLRITSKIDCVRLQDQSQSKFVGLASPNTTNSPSKFYKKLSRSCVLSLTRTGENRNRKYSVPLSLVAATSSVTHQKDDFFRSQVFIG